VLLYSVSRTFFLLGKEWEDFPGIKEREKGRNLIASHLERVSCRGCQHVSLLVYVPVYFINIFFSFETKHYKFCSRKINSKQC